MKIQTNDEYVAWRGVNYLLDRENELAIVPSQIRDAGMCYKRLMRRGKISTQLLEADKPQPLSFWYRVRKRIGR